MAKTIKQVDEKLDRLIKLVATMKHIEDKDELVKLLESSEEEYDKGIQKVISNKYK